MSARYFLDILNGTSDQVDVVGTHFENDEAARLAARQLLAQRIHAEVLCGGDITVCVRARREGSTQLFSVTISITDDVQRLDS